jgi:protein-disulfide isomerase
MMATVAAGKQLVGAVSPVKMGADTQSVFFAKRWFSGLPASKSMKLSLLVMAAAFACLSAPPDIDRNKALGNPTAPITVEVFSSFDCSHCRDFHEQTAPALFRDYVATGKVYLVSREFPLAGHPHAREAANYATAAARIGKYQQVADALFSNQAAWSRDGQVWSVVAGVLTPQERSKVQALANDPTVVSEVQRDVDAAIAARLDRTPTLVVSTRSNRYPVPGSPRYDVFRYFLNSLLK